MDSDQLFILMLTGGSTLLFGVSGLYLFSRGWESYEQKYVGSAATTLDAMYLTIPPQHIAYLSLMCFVILGGLAWFIFDEPVVGVIAGVVGLPVPMVVLGQLKKRRDRLFGIQLIDALVNMGNSLKAGFSLIQAFQLIEREMDNPISQEFRLLNQEIKLGTPMEEGLQHLYRRMPSEDLDLVVTSILISREIGGNLTEVFDNIAHTIRDRHQIEGKIRALTAQGKLQGIIMSILPVAVGFAIHLVNPTLLEPLYRTPVGWFLMVLIAVLIVTGYFWIRKIVSIDI
jgi:tight adherence protein B